MVEERDLTWSQHRRQCAGDILQNCTLEPCMILLANVAPVNSIKKRKYKSAAQGVPNKEQLILAKNLGKTSCRKHTLFHLDLLTTLRGLRASVIVTIRQNIKATIELGRSTQLYSYFVIVSSVVSLFCFHEQLTHLPLPLKGNFLQFILIVGIGAQ